MRAAGHGGSAHRWPHRPGSPAVRLAGAVILLVLAALGTAARGVTRLSTAGMLTVGADPVTFIAGVAFVAAACLVLAAVLALLIRRRRRPEDGFAGIREPTAPWWVRALVTLAALALIALPRRGHRVGAPRPAWPAGGAAAAAGAGGAAAGGGGGVPGPGRRRLPARRGSGRAGGGRAGGDGAVAAPPAAGELRAARLGRGTLPAGGRGGGGDRRARRHGRCQGSDHRVLRRDGGLAGHRRVTAPGRRHPRRTAEPRRGRRDQRPAEERVDQRGLAPLGLPGDQDPQPLPGQPAAQGVHRGAVIVAAQAGQLIQRREKGLLPLAARMWPPTLAGRDHRRLRRS